MGRLWQAATDCVEPFAIPAIYVSGVAHAFVSNGDCHVVYYTEQPDACGNVEKVITVRVILPVGAFAAARGTVDQALAIAGARRRETN